MMIVRYGCLLFIIERQSLLDVGDGFEAGDVDGGRFAVSFV